MKKIFSLLFLMTFLSSCVSNKRITYLQGNTNKEVYNLQHKNFKTQINDILIIDIKSKDEELTNFFNSLSDQNSQNGSGININPYLTGYRIDTHGNIRLPYIGEMNVVGYTTDEVRLKIEKELSKDIRDSNKIFVNVKYAGIKYTILGEINTPGTSLLLQYEANIIDAIANSGDISEYGNRTNVEVIRQEKNGIKKYQIDLTNINSFNSDVFLLKNNDIINIKPIRQKPIGIGTTGLSVFNTVVSTLTVALTTYIFINSLEN